MSFQPDYRSALVLKEVVYIWRDVDPVEGYAGGLKGCEGRFFVPTTTAKTEILRRIDDVRARLPQIKDPQLRTASSKLLSSISLAIQVDSPDEQVLTCFISIWYTILKNDHKKEFVRSLLDRALELIHFEHSRWRGMKFTGEVRKACVDACSSLDGILIVLASKNPDVIDRIRRLSAAVTNFRSLFSFPVNDPNSLDELFDFFEANAGPPVANPLYPQILDQMFDYGATLKQMHAKSLKMLEEELAITKNLIRRISAPFGIPSGASLGTAFQILRQRYRIAGGVVPLANKMMSVLNRFIDNHVQDIGRDPDLMPKATPDFLVPLVTSGAAISLNYLKRNPFVQVLVTEDKTTSFLTLLNVLVHEATHGYSPLILSGIRTIPSLTKLKSWLCIPFYEATAFHREFELLNAIKKGLRQHPVPPELRELLDLFDIPPFPLRHDVLAFEAETRFWRISRALRTICDVEVNTGKKTYVDFIKWATRRTGLSRATIHYECFTFLSYPGYTPSYSFCGLQYQELQKEAKIKRKVPNFDFNSKVHRMGLLPWTLCVDRMKAIGLRHRSGHEIE